jgi:hypothetical protein
MDSDARSQNGFLASLDADDFEALRPHLPHTDPIAIFGEGW